VTDDTTLAAILSPVTTAEFFDRYWGKEHLHLSRPEGYYDQWVKVQDLDILLRSQVPAVFADVYRDGNRCPVEEWTRVAGLPKNSCRIAVAERLLDLYRGGATIVLNGAHRTIPPLAEACRRVSSGLGFPVQANIYITPPNARAFPRHRDSHEVVVLQLHGAKSWRLFSDSAETSFILTAGDMLYIPSGLDHEGITGEDASIHVALGLKPVYPYQLLEELAVAARADHRLSRPFAPGTPSSELSLHLRELLDSVSPATLCERLSGKSLRDFEQGWPQRLSDLLHSRDLNINSVVRGRTDIVVRVRVESRVVRIEYGNQSLTAPVFLKCAIDQILAGTDFKIGGLQGLISDEGRVRMVGSFVQAGFALIVKT
jgi:lysine-specific demethylase/histidyl-hydroxylase NO66